MQSQNHKLGARIPKNTFLSYICPDRSRFIISQKASKLSLFTQSDFNEDPFNLTNDDPNTQISTSNFQMAKEIDLNIGTLVFLSWTDFETEPAFVIVSNDKSLVVLDADLQEIFRNEELSDSTDLCFFTCACLRRTRSGHFQGLF